MVGKINSRNILSESGKHNFRINGFTNYIGDLCFPNERKGFNKPPVNIGISGECHCINQDIYLKGYVPEMGVVQVLAATFNGSINCVNISSAPFRFYLDRH